MNAFNIKGLSIGGKDVIRLTVSGGLFWKGLPSGYTALDYIEATGTQYIDTNFKANQDTRIVCDIMWTGGMNGFGARQAVATRNFSVRVIGDNWQLGYGSDGGVATGTIAAKSNEWQTVDINKNSLYVDGEFSVSREYVSFTTPQTLALGAIKAGSSTPSMYYGTAKYRGCQIYDNGTLVRDMIPCKDPSGKIGMYDTVNAVFYGNAGTGEFEYAEATATTAELGVAVLGTMILGS